MKKNMKKILGVTLAACMAVSSLAGCSNSPGKQAAAPAGGESAAGGSAAQSTATGDPIKVGVSNMVTGPMAAGGIRMKQAITMAFEEINANGGGTLSEDTTYLLERSLDLYDSTNGVFDIAIYPIMDAWGFTTGNYTIPSDETIESLLPLTDANDILYDKDSASISFAKDGMKIDFGGIAKGYTSGRIADIYRECGVTSGLINLGGNVQVVGTKTDGSKWRVAVQSPEAEDDYLGILSTADRAVITSGGYERYFEQDGMKYHHIIDPSTGHPANNGLVSVTIVSADGTLADGLSTSLFIMGKDKAAEYWRAHSDEFDTILEDEDGVLYVTEGIADDFASDHETNIIRKDGDT